MSDEFSLPSAGAALAPVEVSEGQALVVEEVREEPIPYGLSGEGLSALDLEAIALPEARVTASSRAKAVVREIAETLLLALFIFLTVRGVVQNFKVEGSSMEPTLHHGQYLLVNKAAYAGMDVSFPAQLLAMLPEGSDTVLRPFGAPNRGDIVVFRYPRDPSRDFIKRVVALPGEKVEVRSGIVYVNDQRLEEPYVLENPTYSREASEVPEDNFFVLGDNRNNSSDSHVWGPVPFDNIIGRAWLTYWPWQDWGVLTDRQAAAVR